MTRIQIILHIKFLYLSLYECLGYFPLQIFFQTNHNVFLLRFQEEEEWILYCTIVESAYLEGCLEMTPKDLENMWVIPKLSGHKFLRLSGCL